MVKEVRVLFALENRVAVSVAFTSTLFGAGAASCSTDIGVTLANYNVDPRIQ